MKPRFPLALMAVASLFATGCTTSKIHYSAMLAEPFIFGEATDANMAAQSIRGTAPNPHVDIEGGQGGRAGQATANLRQDRVDALKDAGVPG